MVEKLGEADAERLAMIACAGVTLGDWKPRGLAATDQATDALKRIARSEVTVALDGSRLSPSGAPLDLWSPSPWHALCALQLQESLSRANRGSYASAMQDPIVKFGRRPFYRGQAKAWDIRPTGWRKGGRAGDAIRAFETSLRDHAATISNPLLSWISEVRPEGIEGLAQHYEIETNLVDFSLRSIVAVAFACGDTFADTGPVQPRGLSDPRLAECAVIYVVSAPVMAAAGHVAFDFPPSFSQRLYKQQGLFVDFGDIPAAEFEDDYAASWTWVQQNCQRVFFPRRHPTPAGCDRLRSNDLMDGDEFLIELAKAARQGRSLGVGEAVRSAPWREADGPALNEAAGAMHSEFCSRIDSYLRSACLVTFQESGECFDPLMFGLLDRDLSSEIDYFLDMSKFVEHPGMLWTAGMIHRARSDAVLLP